MYSTFMQMKTYIAVLDSRQNTTLSEQSQNLKGSHAIPTTINKAIQPRCQ